MAVTQAQRIVDLSYGGHPISQIANLMGVSENLVRQVLQDLSKIPSGGAAPASVNQRAVDLAYAGHSIPEVANLLGIGENQVRTLLQDTSQSATPPSSGALVSSPAVVSGVAQQDATGQPSEVYVAITGGAGGTVKVDIGAANTVTTAIIPAGDATVSRTVNFRLPASWWFKVTVAGAAAIASAKQVTG